jgi:hypothetical protein
MVSVGTRQPTSDGDQATDYSNHGVRKRLTVQQQQAKEAKKQRKPCNNTHIT